MTSYYNDALTIRDIIVKDRRHLHQNAEVAHNLPQTVAYVREQLASMGYDPKDVGDSGLVAVAGSGKVKKTILLRADMDALPMREESGLDFACATGAVHACGHDMHTAMLLGAARILKKREKEIKGTVKLMFQPAEEVFTGAASMIADGVLKNPDVDAAIALHVAADQPVGYMATSKGYALASSDCFQIDIHGKGCHGAMPHLGVDPINVAAHIHTALQEVIAREIPAPDAVVLTIGLLHSGTAMNIIPNLATMKGTIRARAENSRQLANKRMKEICEHIALAFNARAEVTVTDAIPGLECNSGMVDLVREVAGELQVANKVISERNSMGSEDFAFVSHEVPSVFLWLGAALADPQKRFAGHNPKIVYDENCLPIGSAMYAASAMKWLERNT